MRILQFIDKWFDLIIILVFFFINIWRLADFAVGLENNIPITLERVESQVSINFQMLLGYFVMKIAILLLKRENPDIFEILEKNTISEDIFTRLSQIPEEIENLNDALDFLIKFYYKHAELTKAQQILSSEEGLQ